MESEQTEIKKVVVPEGAELIDEVFYVCGRPVIVCTHQ